MSASHVAHLRRRAWRLRRLSTMIERQPLLRLDRYAGVDTWRGPRPDECLQLLRSAQHSLLQGADDLVAHAWALDRQADEIELALQVLG